MAAIPVLAAAVKTRFQVAAIDFGTTYSGYAFSFFADYKADPLKIHTNKWESTSGNANMVSLKAPSCALFTPEKEFHSFGYDAEEEYANLAINEQHHDWFYFSRFKMLLYENKSLKRDTELPDDKGLRMPALTVFTECIRYLHDHCTKLAEDKNVPLETKDTHWVLTVPAIWDDSAKQFMREAAVQAGIPTDQLSLALEPEAASLFCRHLPVEKVQDADGTVAISNLTPGKCYLVLDAGGGTVDITVHETQPDGTVKEVYKANGGPWGGTTIDKAFISFLEDIAGKDVLEIVQRDHKEDFLELMRSFEIKKKTFNGGMDPNTKVQFRLPICIHDTHRNQHRTDFRRSLLMRQSVVDQVSFTGDKLRVTPQQVMDLFTETCDHIVNHLKTIFSQPSVQGTETILMVGGFSESRMLQDAVRTSFPGVRIVVPEDAGLAVLKGAVIFGHNPSAIGARVSKFTYGIEIYTSFIKGVHEETRKVILDGVEKCDNVFDKHVEIDQEVYIGFESPEKEYRPPKRDSKSVVCRVYTSTERNPMYIDGCTKLGSVTVDVSDIDRYEDRDFVLKLIYGNTELGVMAKKKKTGELIQAKFNFLD